MDFARNGMRATQTNSDRPIWPRFISPEIVASYRRYESLLAVEGAAWSSPPIAADLADAAHRHALTPMLRSVETQRGAAP